jgi:hypothetical protein
MSDFSIETRLTANGSTEIMDYVGFERATFWASGTFGGGTLTLECSRDGGIVIEAVQQLLHLQVVVWVIFN